MRDFTSIDILIGVVSLLVTIVGFIGAFLLKRLEKGNDLLVSIDKSVAVLNVKVKTNEENIQRNEVTRHTQELLLIDLRSDIKELQKELNNLKIEGE